MNTNVQDGVSFTVRVNDEKTVFFDHLVAPVEVKPLSFREKAHR